MSGRFDVGACLPVASLLAVGILAGRVVERIQAVGPPGLMGVGMVQMAEVSNRWGLLVGATTDLPVQCSHLKGVALRAGADLSSPRESSSAGRSYLHFLLRRLPRMIYHKIA